MNVILRIQNLRTHLPEVQVMAEISSYNFLHRIQNLLCTTDYLELSPVYIGLSSRKHTCSLSDKFNRFSVFCSHKQTS